MRLELDAGVSLPGEGPLHLVADIHAPAQIGETPVALFCLPGGAMNRHYYDLQWGAPDASVALEVSVERAPAPAPAPTLRDTVSPAHDSSFSFARQMTARGYLVITLDHLGVGESSRPADSYALTAELLVQANANALEQITESLRTGSLLPGVPALPKLRTVGVGHSMGAMMTVLQQAATQQHAAVALLGFSTRGLPEYVPEALRALGDDTAAIRARIPEFARRMFVVDYPEVKPSPQGTAMFAGASADPRGVEAIKAARDRMLPYTAFMSMLPGNVAPEAAQIDVPVFLGVGERDMAGVPQRIPAAFTASRDIALHILPEAGHSHFLFASRFGLFERLDVWLQSILHMEA